MDLPVERISNSVSAFPLLAAAHELGNSVAAIQRLGNSMVTGNVVRFTQPTGPFVRIPP